MSVSQENSQNSRPPRTGEIFKTSSSDPNGLVKTGDYYSWKIGRPTPVQVETEAAVVLTGGGGMVDEAMLWALERAGFGDVLVFRNAATDEEPWEGVDDYNLYFWDELYESYGIEVNSCETIFLNSPAVANHPEVLEKVNRAAMVFFTGGDQYFYWAHMKGTALLDTLNERQQFIPITGESAGSAIQGEFLFSLENGGTRNGQNIEKDAIQDPYFTHILPHRFAGKPAVTIQKEFLKIPFLKNVIVDTHYDNPDRRARHVTFMARMSKDFDLLLPKGIGVDEATSVCIDAQGIARVFGFGTAFFAQQNTPLRKPEICLPGQPLDWYHNRKALKVYRLNASKHGSGYFDLKDWTTCLGGDWYFYYSDFGSFGSSY